ncbi:Autophagy protein Atg8 ubiquitin-like [Trypanosoma melophagium]|uniref:Autophagy protein Atg8 ubiquitin-like n=1 Tax=Trypanosoma melophagium TaxID=715481 RepID=UPI00351A4D43|nr:Autophagy protein Atg8 ubiquitin-like [Trypanosoma melophagium]
MPRRYLYQCRHSLEARKKESTSIRRRYPHHVPLVCEPAVGMNTNHDNEISSFSASTTSAVLNALLQRRQVLRELDYSKFLLPEDASMQQLLVLLRRRLLLESEQGLFLFLDNSMPSSSACMGDLYLQKKDEDGFLYMTYGIESTFGAAAENNEKEEAKEEK